MGLLKEGYTYIFMTRSPGYVSLTWVLQITSEPTMEMGGVTICV